MPTAEEIADVTVSKLLSKTLGSSGPNVGQDLERTEAIERVLLDVQTDVAEIKAAVAALTPATAKTAARKAPLADVGDALGDVVVTDHR